jgi:hypothetical protein
MELNRMEKLQAKTLNGSFNKVNKIGAKKLVPIFYLINKER